MKTTIIELLALGLIVFAMSSCSVHLGADGSKDATLDGPSLLEILDTVK